jgi:hypothetical protein
VIARLDTKCREQARLAVYRRLGSREGGSTGGTGKLDREWRDVVVVELLLGRAAEP